MQLGFFFHMQLALGTAAPAVTRPIAFATSFMLLFSVVIALFKDVPDVKGDSHVRTARGGAACQCRPTGRLRAAQAWAQSGC